MTLYAPGLSVRCLLATIAAPLVLAACATPQSPPPAGGTPTPSSSAPAPSTAAPSPGTGSSTATAPSSTGTMPQATAPAPAPVDPAAARAQAQKLALEAVDQLQNGDEASARVTLERAMALDPSNDLAKKLDEQIRADAERELGSVFFRYTVQKDDTLSKLAQQYLGDRFRFYLLAKYNDIANPSRLAAGQVIRLPGKGPLPAPVAAAPEAPPAPPPPPEPQKDVVAELLAKAQDLEKGGNVEGAYFAYVDVLQRAPNHPDATKRRDAIRTKLVAQYDREATQAFQRQNLDLAIAKWDRVLEIDPANRKARLERDRAADLKKRMQAKFGNK